MVGDPAGNPGGLTTAALAEWAQGTGGIATIREDPRGPLGGGHDAAAAGRRRWTHYAHGADQNRHSKDDALKYPYLLQWTGKPYSDGKFDMVVAAAAVCFVQIRRSAIQARRDYGAERDNGRILWQGRWRTTSVASDR